VKSICFVATSPFAVNAFLLGHLQLLSQYFQVTLCVNKNEYPLSRSIDARVHVLHVPIERKISPFNDFLALLRLIAIFRRSDFDVVHSITPKGGALAMLAGFLCRVPNRIHTFTGQVWVTRSGVIRRLLKLIDRLIVGWATTVFSDSASQSRFLERELGLAAGRVGMLGDGSIAGVDVERFRPNDAQRENIRQRLSVGPDAFVFLFVGRIARDKGVCDLVTAFRRLSRSRADLSLWVVGPDEEKRVAELQALAGEAGASICWIGPSTEPESYMAGADLLVLPSYREGFGLVVVEAAGCGLPTLAYEIDGVVDAVERSITGVLVPPRDVDALSRQMEFMAGHSDYVKRLGLAARQRVIEKFTATAVSKAWLNFYNQFT